ncbi:MAG TPA: hypothetical protein VK446_14625 [Methylocystis sp.]|nr:hypothetical protein [Methylocystis sp.]
MTTAITDANQPRRAGAAKIFAASLVSAFAPGFLFGILLCFAPGSLRNPGNLLAIPFFGAFVGAVVGAPFAGLVFSPLVVLLSRRRRLSWLAITVIGFFSVFSVGVAHCVFFGDLSRGWRADAAFALFGAIAGFAFWLMVGDVDRRPDPSRQGNPATINRLS